MIHYKDGGYGLEGVRLDPAGGAFRFGAGLWETVYYNGRELCHLDRHLDRLLHGLRSYGLEYATVDFPAVAGQVLNRNGLEGRPARVDIVYPVDGRAASPVLTAEAVEPKPYKAFRLCVCEDRHVSALNAVRTTNGMFRFLALRQATARGFDDAALFDLGGNVLEAAGGALVFEKQGQFVCVDSPYCAPSVALDLARTVLDILPVRVPSADLESFRHAYLLNSLIGMRPVVAVGETAFVPDDAACDRVSPLILGESA
ncbi:aminotransferase class IV [Pseudodesulfovibrio mercurii]|uniref:Aminotransferase class IV n=1 Tax=Pseudodesulfovibrio mercurii TaxID=641491 RepID=F0JBK1_9BACT|nr:aminotransferase class IV [Pseudodesulfovibrio mercurii]EGB15504.1 aminotransferase class IV [Pseudodesulfovibrio mercurii]